MNIIKITCAIMMVVMVALTSCGPKTQQWSVVPQTEAEQEAANDRELSRQMAVAGVEPQAQRQLTQEQMQEQARYLQSVPIPSQQAQQQQAQQATCRTCKGSGQRICSKCGGRGLLTGIAITNRNEQATTLSNCQWCNGTGVQPGGCFTCKGSGTVRQ